MSLPREDRSLGCRAGLHQSWLRAIFSCSFGRGVPDFSRVPCSIRQSDSLVVNCIHTMRGSLTRMQSGTPSKLAEGDFFMQFWQGGARLQQSPLQHPPVRFTRGKLHLVREVSPFDSEFTTRRSLTRMQSGTLSKSAEGDIFRRVIVHFLKNTCLRTMECLHCELKAFSDCAYIYA